MADLNNATTDSDRNAPRSDLIRRLAAQLLERCDIVAQLTEEPGKITRTFLCEPMRDLHERLSAWMRDAGLVVRIDAIGNLIGRYEGTTPDAPLFLVGSHLDSVPDAGKYDGVLGVLLAVAAVHALNGCRLPYGIDVIGFSEEEGVRYRSPFLGSQAVCGSFDPTLLERTDARGISMADAIRNFGLDPAQIPAAAYRRGRLLGYLEAHIEQGPVLDARDAPLGIVEAIVGQTRMWMSFEGQAGHAGTLPMDARKDALAAAAEFVLEAERHAGAVPGLRATVGTLSVTPGAVNVVPGRARLSLDLRHTSDTIRERALAELVQHGNAIAARRGVRLQVEHQEHQCAVPTDPKLTELLAAAVRDAGLPAFRMPSGAGHDAAIMASRAPIAMLFVRSPGGVSHHPSEHVWQDDVEAALGVMVRFLEQLVDGLGL
jgi:allantoate deiminase